MSVTKNKAQQKKKDSFLSSDEQDDSQISKNRVGDWRAFITLYSYTKSHRLRLGSGIFLVFVSSSMAITSAWMMGAMVTKGLEIKDWNQSILFAVAILGVELAMILTMWWGRLLISEASSKVILQVREKLFYHLQKLPLGFYDRQPQGRVVTRITHDVEGIEQFFSNSLGRLVNASITAVLAILAMAFTYPQLGIKLTLAIIPAIVFVFSTREIVRRVSRRMSRLSSVCNAKLSEFLNGLSVIRAYGLEKWSKEKYDESVSEHLKSQLHANTLYAWSRPLVSFLCGMPLIALLWFGGKELILGTMTIGLFVTYMRYCERFFMPIRTLANELHVIQQAFTSAERVVSFLKHADETVVLGADGKFADSEKMLGHIEFKDVWMSYEKNNWVLRGLNFDIREGEKVGLVGTTGCGKTSTVSLLSRLYEYQQGEVLLDGVSLRDYERAFLRQKIGFVSQDVVIFRGSLRENIITEKSISDNALYKVCQLTGFDKVMTDRELSFDTEILEDGANLSVGEKQLLSLTRVLARDPKILILDEATANIDPDFEKQIQEAIEKAMYGRTCLFIAHRLDTLKICDRILVFDQGQLVEEGAEEKLYSQRGHFYNLQNANLI